MKNTGRGKNPNSLANLSRNAGRFAYNALAAAEAGHKSGLARQGRANIAAVLEKHLAEAVAMLTEESTLEGVRQLAKQGSSQSERILAAVLTNTATAFDALQWLYERVRGRSVQMIRQNTELRANAEKPAIVFADSFGRQPGTEAK